MTEQKIREYLKKRTYWYHKIRLAPDIVTPGFNLEPLWDQVRRVRGRIDYRGKAVLDIASFDGMFAFEAEQLGASRVIATDCLYRSFDNFLFCREVLGAKAMPYFNVSPYNLVERLDVYREERYEEAPEDRRFDVVQHLGLLYHLRDPLLSLSQARSMLKPGGALLIETDVVLERQEPFMLFNGLPHATRVRDNYSVWWAPTRACLFEMLEASLFTVEQDSYSEFAFDVPSRAGGRMSAGAAGGEFRIGRGAVVARAADPGKVDRKFLREMMRGYRNPGLVLPESDLPADERTPF